MKDVGYDPTGLAREVKGIMSLLELLPRFGPIAAFGPAVDTEMSIDKAKQILTVAQEKLTPFDALDPEVAAIVYEAMSPSELFETIASGAIPQSVFDRVMPSPTIDSGASVTSWESVDEDEDVDMSEIETHFDNPY